MRLRVVLPRFSPAIERVVVHTWHKAVGDEVGYGDALCDVVVEEVTKMQRPISALSRKKANPTFSTLSVSVRYRMTTMDSGVVASLLVGVGDVVSVGDVIATIEADGGVGEANARCVVDLIREEVD